MKICDKCRGEKDVKEVVIMVCGWGNNGYFKTDLCKKCRRKLFKSVKDWIKKEKRKVNKTSNNSFYDNPFATNPLRPYPE